MASATIDISAEVADVLNRCTITGNNVYLPAGQLDRKLYMGVNTVLVQLGGKWDKRAKAHVFPSDPKERFNTAMGVGEVAKLISVKKVTQAFYTPPSVAQQLMGFADIKPGMKVLEPSAGHGALADEIRKIPDVDLRLVELDEDSVRVLEKKGYRPVCRDFLDFAQRTDAVYDRVVMNPPFTKGQDIDHVLTAYALLKPGGRLAAIMSGNVMHGTTKRHKAFQALLESAASVCSETLEAGAFKESGTMVSTIIFGITKPG